MSANQNRIMSGAIILLIAGLLSKVLSALYRVPLQNLTGDIGFYLYQQIYPLIAIVMIVSLYGFPTAISKLTAEKLENNEKMTYRNHFVPIFLILFFCSTVFALLLVILAPTLASFIKDESLASAFRLGALLLLIIPFTSLFRGIFQAENEMKQTAVSQVLEQTVRVFIIVICSVFIWQNKLPVSSIAITAIIASIIGMLLSLIYLSIVFIKRYPIRKENVKIVQKIPWKSYVYTVLILGIFATINHITFVMMQLVDVFTLVPQLMKTNMTQIEAMTEKGIFDRGVPLIQFGIVIGSSFAIALIPTMSKRSWQAQFSRLQEAIALSFYLATGATIGLIATMPAVNRMLFMDEAGTTAIQILALSIFLLSLTMTKIAILQASRYVKKTMLYLLVAFLVKWASNVALVPLFGIHGSATATVTSLLCLYILVIFGIKRNMNVQMTQLFHQVKWLALVKASSVMLIYIIIFQALIYSEASSRFGALVYTFWIVISGALIFITILLKNNALTNEQIAAMPFSRIVMSLQQMGRHQNGG